jgi:S1-C subfamily serine protease
MTENEPTLTTQDAPSTTGPKDTAETSRRLKRPGRRMVILTALVVGLLAGFGGAWLQDTLVAENGTPFGTLNIAGTDGNAQVSENEASISAVAQKVSPSVVSILTTSREVTDIYGRSFQQEGAGSGMIVSSNGYIMTNKHVVEGSTEVTVVLSDGTTYDNAQVVGSDPLNDVAFLKVAATDLPAVTLGESKTIRTGQTVVAIGNALGQYQNTVTSGIVSATGRPVVASTDGTANGAESLTDLIQTDAAINSGNSGGPLLNLSGQVIGINTAVAEGASNIGFAIPVGATKGMLKELVATGELKRAYLGVQYVSITPEVRQEYDLDVNRGDYVTADRGASVQRGGPADKAGIRDGDIITAVNGAKVGSAGNVSSLVSEYRPGEKVEITLLRDGQTRTVTATLGTYES